MASPRYLSLCSGIEAASVAWKPLGWKPVAFAEIDKFPCAVLTHHYPDVPNLGDITQIKASDFSNDTIDIIVGGTPCQSFSVAGLRKGLDDPRGQLTEKFFQLVGELRPRWVVWENVPGVLSIEHGRVFGAVLWTLGQCGYGFAYRVLDAQYFGVPQRRRRVFVVGYLGDWRPAAAVLFERHCLQGHTPPRREAGQSSAPTIAARTQGGGGLGTDFDCDGGLVAHCLNAHNRRLECDNESFVAARTQGGEGFDASEDGTGRQNLVVSPPLTGAAFVMGTQQGGAEIASDICPAITAAAGTSGNNQPVLFSILEARSKVQAADGPRYKALGNSWPCRSSAGWASA